MTPLEIIVDVVDLTNQRMVLKTIKHEEYEQKMKGLEILADTFCTSEADKILLSLSLGIISDLVDNHIIFRKISSG